MRTVLHTLMLIAVLWPQSGRAETAYVTDNLRLGLHEAANTSDRAFRTLESGQELEILSRDQFYANVRLPDGTVGNVKVGYLVFEKPARLIVSEVQQELEKVTGELESTRAAFAAPGETIAALEARLEQRDSEVRQSATQISDLTGELNNLRSRQEQYKFSLPINWVGGAIFVCLLAGFLAGMWWVDHRSRKRHGGVRVY